MKLWMTFYGIIPVSKFKECKTRLSPFLSEEERGKPSKSHVKMLLIL